MKRNMKGHLLVLAVASVGLLLCAGEVRAHHGAANVYDMSKPVMLKGTITKFEWTNPHNQILFDVADEKGNVTHWIAATEPPQVMLERGWTRRSLKEGDEVTVYIFAAKNGAPVGNLQKIVLAGGKELTTSGPVPAPPPAAR
ncbi:MAG TPA: DUF6152 family protein [Vicinamibacterales bacterium]|nr:DUF6152 family protein [Vicinamibacterales bacterium]